MKELEEILSYEFNNPELLERALTHSSYANEVLGDTALCNERLEFLGDAVLDMAVTNYLFNHYTDKAEGALTKLRAAVVCERSLAVIGKDLGISRFMRFGRGEEISGGRERDSIVADCMEAIIGAVYEDGGQAEAEALILRLFTDTMESAAKGRLPKDAKTSLQEFLQKDGPANIEYRLISQDGPDHAKVFTMGVFINGVQLGTGSGKNKKEAEAMAASAALSKLGQR